MPDRPTELTAYGQALMDQLLADAKTAIAAQTELWASVATARDEGIPWRIIGQALGITRQAAQERFSKPPAGRLV